MPVRLALGLPEPIICASGDVHGYLEPPKTGPYRIEVSDGSVIEAADSKLVIATAGGGEPTQESDRSVTISGAIRWVEVLGTDQVLLPSGQTNDAEHEAQIDALIAWDDQHDPDPMWST